MIDELDTLDALFRHKTMARAATSLRLGQSAVSKRIASLEAMLGKKLLVRQGRGVFLTQTAIDIVTRSRPLLCELRSIVREDSLEGHHRIAIGMSETILASWGARVLLQVQKKNPGLVVEAHTHRSPTVIDRVRSGEYMLGICAGSPARTSDLHALELGREAMVLIGPAELQKTSLLCIEEHAETWVAIKHDAAQAKLVPTQRLESFFAMAQLANSGATCALVPAGVAQALGISAGKIRSTKLARPIMLIARKSAFERTLVRELIESFRKQVSIIPTMN